MSNGVNDNLYVDSPYIPEKDPRDINAVQRLKDRRNMILPDIHDDEIQENELSNAVKDLESKISQSQSSGNYVATSSIGQPNGVAPLNALGKVPDTYLPPSSGGQGIVALSLAGTLAEIDSSNVAMIPETTDTCAGLLSCEDKEKLDSIDLDDLATKDDVADAVDEESVRAKAKEDALDSNKLNKLPNVDDPNDPGYGWPYHIPYNVKFNLAENKATITLQTLTLDNNLTKMDFSQDIPAASTSTAGLLSSQDKVKLDNINLTTKQDKLTAGTNITIDENNVISATSSGDISFDNKTIIKNNNEYQTVIGGWKEITPEQSTELFIDTKGNSLPTYINTGNYEIGWDYNTTITSLASNANTATVHVKIAVLGTTFDNNIILTKSMSIPAIWESSDLTIGANTYKIKVHDGYLGTNQGGLGLVANDHSLDLSGATMQSCALVTSAGSVVYHSIDANFIPVDNETIIVNSEGKIKVATDKYITLSGTSGELTDEQSSILSDSSAFIYLDGKRFDFSNSILGRSGIIATYTNILDESSSTIEITVGAKTWSSKATSLQSKLTAGDNVTIANNVISAIDTKVATSITLGKSITVQNAIGGISAGKVYAATDTLATIIEDLLGGSTPTPAGTKYLYKGVVSEIPEAVTNLTSVVADKATLLASGYTYSGITTNDQYAVLAIDNSLGLTCTEIKVNGFSLGFQTKTIGDKTLYYFEEPTTETSATYKYAFEEV